LLVNNADYFREQVVVACRVIAREGYADLTLGHVSVLDPDAQTVYIKRKGPGLHEIELEDVLAHPLHDDAALKTTPHMHYEAVLHTEVYKRYSGVRAVIHSHPPYATALSATSSELRMVNHDSLLFADGLARFDEFRLITEPSDGQAVAEALGDRRAILLGNHGVVVTGESIAWAVLTALTLERAIKVQMIAESLGTVREIPIDAAREYASTKFQAAFVEEYWAGWTRNLRRSGLDVPRQVSSG
jgi:L-fuculose-phosphate aldolase